MPDEEFERFFLRLVTVHTAEDLEPSLVRHFRLLPPVLDQSGKCPFDRGIAVMGEDDAPASFSQIAGIHARHGREYVLFRPLIPLPQVSEVIGVNGFTLP